MNPFVSNFAVLWMLLIVFLFFSPSTCETTQRWNADDGSYLNASVPCKGINAIFPCGKTNVPSSDEENKVPISMTTTKSQYPWEKSRKYFPWRLNIPLLLLKRSDGFHPWKKTWQETRAPFLEEKTQDSYPLKMTVPPLPSWEEMKTPLITKHTQAVLIANKTQDSFHPKKIFPDWPWGKHFDTWSWERTKDPFPRVSYPWSVTIAPFIYNWDKKITSNNIRSSSTVDGVKVLIFVGAFIAALAVYTFKYWLFNECWVKGSSNTPQSTLHRPTEGDIFTIATDRDQSESIYYSRANLIPDANLPSANNSRTLCSDKPPDYSSVVLDSYFENTNLPEAEPSILPDSPPPPYDISLHA